MLEKLRKRVLERGIDLVVNDELIEYVASEGYDVKFGARPMNRVIENKIEQKIADGLISGKYSKGVKVELQKEDFS